MRIGHITLANRLFAAPMAGQNRSGLSLTRANTAGSDPSGSSVAEMKDTTNKVLSPISGKASVLISHASKDCIQASISGIIGMHSDPLLA